METARPYGPRIFERYASAVCFHPSGTRFLAASAEAIDEFDAATGEAVRTLWSTPGRTLDLMYSPDGNKVLACGVVGHRDAREPVDAGDEGWTMIWDARKNQTTVLEGHTAPVMTAAFGPGGLRCVTGSLDKTLRLWDAESGGELHTFRGHLGGVNRVAYSPRGDRILSAAQDGAAFWNVARFAVPPVEPLPLAASFSIVESVNDDPGHDSISKPSGALLPVPPGYRPRSIPTTLEGPSAVVRIGKPNPRDVPESLGRWLSKAKTTESREAPPPRPKGPQPNPWYQLCGASRDGRRKIYDCSLHEKIVLRDNKGKDLRTWERPPHTGQVAISPSGAEVVIAHFIGSPERATYVVTVYDADSGLPKHEFQNECERFSGWFAIDPKERAIMMSGPGGSTILRDYETGKQIAPVGKGETGLHGGAAFSPEGYYVVTTKLASPTIMLYDPTELTHVQTLSNHFPVRWFKFSPDETHLLVAQMFVHKGLDLFTMWDTASGRRLWSCCGPSG